MRRVEFRAAGSGAGRLERRRPRGRKARLATVASAVAVATSLAASCRTLTPLPPGPAAPEVDSLVKPPAVRVGVLVDVPRVSVGADSGVEVLDVARGVSWKGRRSRVQRASFVVVQGGTRHFRVQVASSSSEAAARTMAQKTRAITNLEPSVGRDGASGNYPVRVGEFPTREEASILATRIAQAGLGAPWVVEDTDVTARASLRLLETGELFQEVSVIPARGGETLSADATSYRGIFEVRPGDGGLTLVNVVNIEDYLKGVVPNELSPQGFPQPEALKAQAVAARTYALRNRGQFEAKGYDICATPACQVYRGRSSEDPLSTRAVEETRGIAAYYGETLINAYYTSTCGGHTEDGDNIFEGEALPYLRGVACVPEASAWATIRTTATSPLPSALQGLGHDVALLSSLGVLDAKGASPRGLEGMLSESEARLLVSNVLRALHRSGCDAGTEPPLSRRGSFFQFLVGSLCWSERAERLLAPGDTDYLLQVEDRDSFASAGERRSTALLISEGLLTAFPDGTLRPNEVLRRADAVRLLAAAVLRAGGPLVVTAEFRGATAGDLLVRRAGGEESAPLLPGVRLFRDLEGAHSAVSELSVSVGEKVTYVVQDGRVTFLEASQSRFGAAADRSSRYYRWEVRMTPQEIAAAIARNGNVGAVKDLVVRRIGTSGRVVELSVLGTQGELTLKGLHIRQTLGLRENLFVLGRERSASGSVETFIFTGKGWGHGVGLCQVGSYGMALSGSTYEAILKHYYTGIRLAAAY